MLEQLQIKQQHQVEVKMSELAAMIKEEISRQGPMTFARFMELALYHPVWGYYSTATAIGPHGDFYTVSNTGELFGSMLARQFDEMWRHCGCPEHWWLVEYGPGSGALARDVLATIGANFQDLYQAVNYYLIEISPELRKKQQDTLLATPYADKCKWVDDIAKIAPTSGITGCIYGNELIDAFPVHLVTAGDAELNELYVDCNGTEFYFQNGPLSTANLADYFKRQGVQLGKGQRAEANLQARDWLAHTAANLARGFIVIIDYGFTALEMYAPQRFNGTLRCYYRHSLIDDPLINIGHQDITANVNFSVLADWAREAGLDLLGLVTQPDFLLNLGILDTFRGQADFHLTPEIQKKTAAIKQLLLPGGMSGIFKVLALVKGLSTTPKLAGFKARNILGSP